VRQLDLFAERVRRAAGVHDDEIVDAGELAIRLLGPSSIVIVDRLACGARLRWTEKGYRIELRDGLPDINFACAHEVAHWALRTLENYQGPNEERFANYVGAALLMPRALVREGARFYGRKLEPVEPLADAARVSETAATLRLGEVLGDERVVVTKTGNVLRSSADAFAEPDVLVVRRARRKAETPGVARASLRDVGIDEKRIALRAK
jgi:hypothetical protein